MFEFYVDESDHSAVIVKISASDPAKFIHSIAKAAHQARYLTSQINDGYEFDDANAGRKRQTLSNAVNVLCDLVDGLLDQFNK